MEFTRREFLKGSASVAAAALFGGSCAGWAMNSGRIAAEQAKEYLGL